MAEIALKTSRKRKRRTRCRRLRFRLVKFCTYVLLGLLLASPVQAVTTIFGDIEITPEPPPQGNSSHGYFEYVFYVVNKSAERTHTVSLSIPFEKFFVHEDSIRELRRTVQVGAKETVQVSLLQPDHPPLSGLDVAVVIDGGLQEREVHLKPNESVRRPHYGRRGYPPTGAMEPLILLSPRMKPLPTMDPPPGSPAGGMPGGPGGMVPPGGMFPPMRPAPLPPGMPAGAMAARPATETLEGWLPLLLLPVGWNGPTFYLGALSRLTLASQMGEIEMAFGKPGLPPHGFQFVHAEIGSSNWLAYCRYDGIIITATELNALPAGTQTALWQYVETGGALLVLGRIDLRGLSAATEAKKDKAGWLSVGAGFGICRVSPDANYETWDAEHFADLMNDWRNRVAQGGGQRGTVNANQEFPVIDDLGVPIKGLFVLMFLFTLGIGPVNVFVLSRLKRRIWMLWTTPALSLCTCLAVFGYMLISEGWQGQLRSETLTLLDETTHRATTLGWTGIYSPLTPSDGLHFSYATEVIPQRFFEGRGGGARSCTIDWTQDQHFAAGWVEARVPSHFKVRESEMRRERVSLHPEPEGRWSMVNGLGVAIRHFWYADAKGQIHAAEEVAPGARVMLTLTEKESLARPNSIQNILFGPSTWISAMQLIVKSPQNYLCPGIYLAEVDDSPFLEDALRNARMRKLHSLVVGFGKQGN